MSKKTEPIGLLQIPNGKEIPIIGETERYWLCEGTQFRKSNPHIVPIPAPKPAKPKLKKQNREPQEEDVNLSQEAADQTEVTEDAPLE